MQTSNNRSWFSAKSTGKDTAEINIDNEIGAFGVRASDFRDELKALGDVTQIAVHINSPGGEVFDSLAIHNMLARHKAEIIVTIDGIAASGASLVAMAGDQIIMPENAMMMIHDPGGIVVGTSKEMRELADALDKVKSGMISAYAAKSMQERAAISDIMAAETWLTAQEAVDLGFADKLEAAVEMTASFDLSKFKNAPADAGRRQRGLIAHNPALTEVTMTEVEKAAAAAAEKKKFDDAKAEGKAEAIAEAKDAAKSAAEDKTAAGETVEQMTARITADITERHKQIVAACEIAGVTAKATEFIASAKTLPEVLAELQALRAAGGTSKGGKGKSDEKEINTHLSGNAEISASWNKQVERHNARVPNGRSA